MYSVLRTGARPPQMWRVPRCWPLSQFNGATPTRAAIRRRLSCPSSGKSASSVVAKTGPTPGVVRSRFSLSRQTGLVRISVCNSDSTSRNCRRSHSTCCWMCCRTSRVLTASRCCSATSISSNWRRRASQPCRACVCSSGSVRGSGRSASAKCAKTSASMRSVLASLPAARAKSRTCRGLTTTTGSWAAVSAATRAISYPPVASTTISATGPDARIRSTRPAIPVTSLRAVHRAPLGRSATSSSRFATSIPTKLPGVIRPLLGPTLRIRAPGPGNCSGCDGVWTRRPRLPRGLATRGSGRSTAPIGSSPHEARMTYTRQGGARLRRATTVGRGPSAKHGPRERRRAEHARPVAEPRVLDRERAPGELGRRLEDAPRDAVEELGQRLEEAAAEDEDLRIEQRHVVRDGLREVARRVGPELARELVARVRGGRDHGGVERVRVVLRQLGEARLDVGGQSVAQAPLEPAARDILLETAARAAGAWPSVGDDLGVAQLARRVARAAPELAVEHRARAHARAHEDRQQRAGPAVHAEAILAPGRGPDVVLDGDGDAEGGGERRGERDVAPAEVGRLDDGAGLRVDLAGAGDADRGEVVQAVGEGGDGAADGLEHCGGAALGLGQGFGLRGEPSVDRDGSRTNAGASEVDADDGGYAFFSSSFRAGVVSSLFASFTPFLNSFTLEPSERASSGRRFAPNRISTITRMMSRSSYP